MEKELKIVPPEGYEIDKKNSTFECIKFKPIKPIRWRDNKNAVVQGYFVSALATIERHVGPNRERNYCVFSSEKQAKSALAMARISQIMANDKRFGGLITDEEWCEDSFKLKYVIRRYTNSIVCDCQECSYEFLAFHTREQRDLFLEENEDLIKDYFML